MTTSTLAIASRSRGGKQLPQAAHAVAAGAELDDADLEKVAGGATVKGDANCGDSDGMMNTVVEINASLI